MAEMFRRIRPTPTNDYLGNPHKGCCTFQHFNGQELFAGIRWSEEGPTEFPPPPTNVNIVPHWPQTHVIPGYLPATVAYCRWFWRVLEPAEGQYDFSVIDKSLEACAQRGQTLAIRLMAFGGATQPQVPEWYARKHPMVEQDRGASGVKFRIPVHDSPEYLKHWGGLIREAGRRYNGHPLVESIDVAFIGPWGEGDGECSREQVRSFVDLWREAWPDTPRLSLIAGEQMEVGVQAGNGWRCDCFGDLGAVGSDAVSRHCSWNHHFDAYPRQVVMCGAQDAWKTMPVHFETCGVPMYWLMNNYDLDFILEQGLKFHGTYFMPKYTALPEKWMDKLQDFCNRLGYRFIIRQASVQVEATPGGQFAFQCWIENVGVAPIYRRYEFALRLTQGEKHFIIPLKDIDIRKWLPGDVWLERTLPTPAGVQKGWADFSVGLIDPRTQKACVRFAVKEQYRDGWVPLAGIEIK